MRSIEDSSQGTRRWSQISFACNLVAILLVGLQYVMQFMWIVLLVDVFVIAGLAFLLKALYEYFCVKTWNAFVSVTPALVLQIVISAAVGLVFWYFWNKPDSAKS